MKQAMAMILAGGRGKRMDILCDHRPKPMLPIGGKSRVIDTTLSNCIHSQIDGIAVLVDYQRSAMIQYMEQWSLTNVKDFHVPVLQPKSVCYKGTADAIYQNFDYLEKDGADDILILAGDHVYQMDYREMISFHNQMRADLTVGIVRVPIKDANRFGTVLIEAEGRIKEFVEKSSTPVSDLASMGIYVFKRSFLIEQLEKDARNPNSSHDFGYAILPNIVKQNRVFGYEFKGYWQDIGTIESYYQANMQLLKEKVNADASPILTINGSAKGCITDVPGYIVNSMISPGCLIGGYVENSILSPGVWVGEKARVINSIVMANTVIGSHSLIENSILDEDIHVGQSCHIGLRNSRLDDKGNITVIGKGVIVPHYTDIDGQHKVLPKVAAGGSKSSVVIADYAVSSPSTTFVGARNTYN